VLFCYGVKIYVFIILRHGQGRKGRRVHGKGKREGCRCRESKGRRHGKGTGAGRGKGRRVGRGTGRGKGVPWEGEAWERQAREGEGVRCCEFQRGRGDIRVWEGVGGG
jgi:hypothetical protein